MSPRKAPAFINAIDAVIVFDRISCDGFVDGVGDGARVSIFGKFPLELFGDGVVDWPLPVLGVGEEGLCLLRAFFDTIGSRDMTRGFGVGK